MMLGLLLARAGVEVMVLEKHADFFRDFRGDTIHPSTLEVIHELGLLEGLLKLPYQKVLSIGGQVGDLSFTLADFSHLPTVCPFVALMPQWDFLDFLASHARRYATFSLKMEHEVTDLLLESRKVVGVRAKAKGSDVEVRADLVVGADGRSSCVRAQSGLPLDEIGAPFDVLWMRLSRKESDPNQSLGNFRAGKALVTINRHDYWQCGYLIKKGAFEAIREKGLTAFQGDIATVAPFLADRVGSLASWDEIKLLTVQINRLRRWFKPGLLCIGDAAHAMSPVGGVGINLAIQDAVATANLLALPLREKRADEAPLARVQKRRSWPTWATQGLQVLVQKEVLLPALTHLDDPKPGWPLLLLNRIPFLRRIPGRLIGMGFRPEHIHSPEIKF